MCLGGQLSAWCESGLPAGCAVARPPATAATLQARTAPEATSHAPPGRLGAGLSGASFPPKPAASPIERRRAAGTGLHGDASPPKCGSSTRPAPRRSSPSQTPSQCAILTLPLGPMYPAGCPPKRWTGSSGARCRPGSAGRRPSGFHRASFCWWAAPSGR